VYRNCLLSLCLGLAWTIPAPLVAAPLTTDAFAPCADAGDFPALAGSTCTTVTVPLDHATPGAGEVSLFLRKFPVGDDQPRRGEVWLVAGGPGESGAAFYPALATLRRAFPGHDLVIPDHRGTGYSSRLCPLQEALDSPDGLALAGEEWGPCIATLYAHADRTRAFSITQAAHDLSGLIAQHRGDGPVYLYGVSYGTQLVLRLLQVAPVPLDGVILDGLVPPEGALAWEISQRTQIVDRVGHDAFAPAQITAVAELVERAASRPAWVLDIPGQDLRQFLGRLLNFPDLRARIPELVETLQHDDTRVLLQTVADLKALAARLLPYPQSPPSVPLVMLITGAENNSRTDLTAEVVATEGRTALFASPLPGLAVDPPLPLYQRDAHFGKLPAQLPPTLVMQGTLDPATPLEGARAHVARLSTLGPVQLATVSGGAHALVLTAPDCFVRLSAPFVSGQTPPADCRLEPGAAGP
jgi:pimeloyl-ACP methyl ester carboxylesterase